LPVAVTDGPEFPWRGIMIDTSRHYLPVSIIKTTLDGCLFNKVNVMHW
jgi:hexosaminidase